VARQRSAKPFTAVRICSGPQKTGSQNCDPVLILLNSGIHIRDKDFALDDGLLQKKLAQGKIMQQFSILADQAGISRASFDTIRQLMLSETDKVEELTLASYLDETTKRNYWQSYQGRLRQLEKT
jgi:serine/threonine-protein kinase HipA